MFNTTKIKRGTVIAGRPGGVFKILNTPPAKCVKTLLSRNGQLPERTEM